MRKFNIKNIISPLILLFVLFGCVMLCSDRTPDSDVIAPEIDINSHEDGAICSTELMVTGRAVDSITGIETVLVSINNEPFVTADLTGEYWKVTETLEGPGTVSVRAYALDLNMNQSEVTEISLQAQDIPAVNLDDGIHGQKFRTSEFELSGDISSTGRGEIESVALSFNGRAFENAILDTEAMRWSLVHDDFNTGVTGVVIRVINSADQTNLMEGLTIQYNPVFPLKLDDWIQSGIDNLTIRFSEATKTLSRFLEIGINGLVTGLSWLPWFVFIILLSAIAWLLGDWKVALFTAVGLVFIWAIGLWEPMISTLALVLIATLIAVLIGVPLGIWGAINNRVNKVITPILDFMQTMPAFVYLIPAIPFFGLGQVSAIFATVIFAIPPSIRLTTLGIQQIPADLIEASDAFGSNETQKLFKLQLPLATPTIMAGINQTIMLSLSMVVIAAMIGAGGLGGEVWKAIQRMKSGQGFVAGLAVVIIAMVLDRITQRITSKTNKGKKV